MKITNFEVPTRTVLVPVRSAISNLGSDILRWAKFDVNNVFIDVVSESTHIISLSCSPLNFLIILSMKTKLYVIR